jgi:transcription initiation factor IIE alpha subunit
MPFNNLRAKPEHLKKLADTLEDGASLTPNEIVKISGLSLTAVYGAIGHLESQGMIVCVRQNKTPKLRVSLKS